MQNKKSSFRLSIIALSLLYSFTTSASEKEKSPLPETNDKISIVENKTGITPSNGSTIKNLYTETVNWLKTPYRRGGTSAKGMDCSGLTSTIYQNVFGIKLQRSSKDMATLDVKDVNKEELKPGDLVFFSTSRKSKRVSHVGVYLGNRHFVHSSSSNGVIISSLDEPYYQRTWVKGGEVKNMDKSLFPKEQKMLDGLMSKPLLVKADNKPHALPSIETILIQRPSSIISK